MKAYYLFGKSILPTDLDIELEKTLDVLHTITDSQEYLQAAYNVITTKYQSSRIRTITQLGDLISTDVDDIWNRSGFLHCTNQNYLLSLLLVRSGHFKESDIKPKWTLVWHFMPHQYLAIKQADNSWVTVDCWGRHYGVAYGNYAHGFNMSIMKSFVTD